MNIASAVILCTIVGAVGAIILVAAAKFMGATSEAIGGAIGNGVREGR